MSQDQIIGFSFVPREYKIPSDNVFLKQFTQTIYEGVGADLPQNYQVDLISCLIVFIGLLFGIWLTLSIIYRLQKHEK